MKRVNIKCPYCGSRALLRPASVVYGANAIDPAAPYYVCARFPGCDSYVAAHRDTRSPMGSLADSRLRRKRAEAHRAFGRLWADGLMTRKQAYRWLQAKLGLPEQETHIGKFSTFRCEQVIQLCGEFLIRDGKPAQRYISYRRKEARL